MLKRDAQPTAPVIGAQQHHRRPVGAREFREQFGLSDERRFAGANDRLLVHGRGHKSAGFTPQAKVGAMPEPGQGRARRNCVACLYRGRQESAGIDDCHPGGGVRAGVLKLEAKFQVFIDATGQGGVADDQELFRATCQFQGDGLERDLRSDAGRISESDGDHESARRLAARGSEKENKSLFAEALDPLAVEPAGFVHP